MILKETVSQLTQFFPGVPIFPALGNHEAVPVNRYMEEKIYIWQLILLLIFDLNYQSWIVVDLGERKRFLREVAFSNLFIG